MNDVSYERPRNVAEALRAIAARDDAMFIGGGTNVLDLMKERVLRPRHLIDITRLPLAGIEATAAGGIRIGALTTNADVAYDEQVLRRYPLLSRAILAGASPQLRNMATTGGNLLQRTRCHYFYDIATCCNKRTPGSGCSAIVGHNRNHAILGASDHCIATHPSDMCVALAALEAVVHVRGPERERTIPFADFHRLPDATPQRDTTLAPHELVTAIELPAHGFADNSAYLKLRDRASYAFALLSVAAALELDSGEIRIARLALGGVAHKPWRDTAAEAALVGRPATVENFRMAAEVILARARPHRHNAFKIDLARRAIVRCLEEAAALEGGT